ncbi:MAG: M48 family metalloprotease, partial [SAR324 cluster bacterium]|nr:M48 family metalloprotease [SAR324 cluster bacterium]
MKTGQFFLTIGIFLLLVQLTYTSVTFADISDFRRRANQSLEQYTAADVDAEILFGRKLAAKILGRYPLLKDEQIQEYVSLLGTGLATQVGRPELKYYFAVIDTQDINAYACPGGYIFITRGAIQSMTNEAQLIGVLAHEIIHVDRKHIVKLLKIKGEDQSITSGLSSVLGASSAGVKIAMEHLADQAFKTLFEEGLSKNDELESDSMGVAIMIGQGYDGRSYQDYIANLQTLIKGGHGEVLSKTHPTTQARVAGIEKTIQQQNPSAQTGKKNESRFAQYVQFQELLLASDFSDFDAETELLFGRDLAAKLIGKYKLLKNENIQTYLSLLGTGIVAQLGASEFQYHFAVLDTDEAKAFAVPGGFVFVTKGALRLMKDEAQLVGVLARQIVHVDQKHFIK